MKNMLSLLNKNKTPTKITIFFDVDGVLNKKSDWKIPFLLNASCLEAFKKLNDTLKKKGYNISYILCSTWRAGKSDTKNSPQYDNLINKLSGIGIQISGQTPLSNKTRQEEIAYYAKRNGIKNYIVIDDDDSLYPNPEKINLFIPDYKTGMTKNDIKSVIKMR